MAVRVELPLPHGVYQLRRCARGNRERLHDSERLAPERNQPWARSDAQRQLGPWRSAVMLVTQWRLLREMSRAQR